MFIFLLMQNVSGSNNSSLSELVRFNTNLAHSFYKITDEASLETAIYALQPENGIEVIVFLITITRTRTSMIYDPLPKNR